MNKEEDGKKGIRLTAREEMDRRLAELSPERYIASPVKRTSEMHFVCEATDEIKRLHTLREMMATKREALVAKNLEVARDAKERILSMDRDAANKEVQTPGSPLFIANETMKNLESQLWRTDSVGKIADTLLWLEIRSQHADLWAKPVLVCSDWSICWLDEDATKPIVITQVTARGNDSASSVRKPKRTVH